MEDVTQSYYLEGAGQDADFVVGSLRKWYAVPDGGFLASDLPIAEEILLDGEEYAGERLVPLVQKWEYLQSVGLTEEERSALRKQWYAKNRALEEKLDCYEGVRRMSDMSVRILSEIDEDAAKQRRAENYSYLYEKLKGMKRLWPVLLKGEGEAPLFVPVEGEG